MPSCNKTKMHFDDRRTAPFIPGAPGILVAGTLGCSGNWEKTRAKLRPEGESVRLAPASSHGRAFSRIVAIVLFPPYPSVSKSYPGSYLLLYL